MGGKLMNTADYEKIVTDALVFGKPAKQIAVELERKETVVFNVLSVSAPSDKLFDGGKP